MSIKLSDLQNETRTIVIDFRGERIELEYYVNVVTPALLKEGLPPSEQLTRMLKRWDIEGDNGEEIPVTVEVIDLLPYTLQGDMSMAIIEDMRGPGEEEKKA